jgi:hypothetical protein
MNAKKIIKSCFTGFLGLLNVLIVTGQNNTSKFDLAGMLENNKIEAFNRQLSPFSEGNNRGIRFSKNLGDGIAWLKEVEFSNGTIELDIRGKDVFQQSFVGIVFHGIDNQAFDAVYFRPFNFQSADAGRKIHAVQYVSHPDNTWSLLREKQNGKYEKAVVSAPDGNEWFHARIVIQYPNVTVYVNGNQEPSLNIEKLNTRITGKIGLFVGNGSDGDFANLQISSQN